MKGEKKMKKERWKRQLLAVAMAAALVVPQGVYAAEEDVDPNFVAIKDTGTGDAQCINDADLVNSEYVPSLYGGSQEKGERMQLHYKDLLLLVKKEILRPVLN